MSETKITQNETSFESCIARLTANQSVAANTWTSVQLNADVINNFGMHSTTTNNHRIGALSSGIYNVSGVVRTAARREGGVRINRYTSAGAEVQGGVMVFGTGIDISTVSGSIYMDAGDYVVLQVFSTVATSITTGSGGDTAADCRLSVIRIS